ncbi:MAG: hypothetical protein EZS28_032356 [Streblomastix strix]|uniref:Uncharacterized protein n=1 Tax=Streblomastix strix TaxID=222440 RepID=A0A5J4UNV9_9EUKA|nr:MAG: hypothetical protein EZS28_032356 [Streblomastix strix]
MQFNDLFAVSGQNTLFVTNVNGNDANSCSESTPCVTLDALAIIASINTTPVNQVRINDYTSLSSTLTLSNTERQLVFISQTSNIQSEIQIKSIGQFSVSGKVSFQWIKFTQQTASTLSGGILTGNIGQDGNLDVNYCSFIDCQSSGGQGGAIYASISSESSITLTSVRFDSCSSTLPGGALTIVLYDGTAHLINVSFIACHSNQSGGAIAVESYAGWMTIEQNCKFNGCYNSQAGDGTIKDGGALFIYIPGGGQIDLTGSTQFLNCYSNESGGAIKAEINSDKVVLNGVTIDGCHSLVKGGAMDAVLSEGGQIEINQTNVFNGCYSKKGGAIHVIIGQSGSGILTIKLSCSFIGCYSTSDSGGAIYSEINNGELNIQSSTTFDTCTCTQPGNGGAVALSQLSQTSKIFISGTTFKDCKTLVNSSNPTYGWGSGIFIITSLAAAQFNDTNFLLSSLTFTGCEAVNKYGHHIHIQSPSTISTGSAIKNGNLLTVSGANDLYTTSNYVYEYMGINTSNAGTGTIDPQSHLDLFRQHYISNVPNPCYIDATNGVNDAYCGGQKYKCTTIAPAINRDTLPPSGIAPSKDINFKLILTTIPSNDNNLQISLPHTYYNYTTIQSDGYVPGGTGYTKYKIPSSSSPIPLFSVTVYGHLEVFGIILDNLIPDVSLFLFDIYNNDGNNNIPNVTINDCEFKQDSTSFSTNKNLPSIIQVIGGYLLIQRTKFENYRIDSGHSLILTRSNQFTSQIYRITKVELISTSFLNINQFGSFGGAIINTQINTNSLLYIGGSSSFTSCQSTAGVGGALYAVINGGEAELNEVTMKLCSGLNGGAIYSTISGDGKLTINNHCQFTSCLSTENGGAIYTSLNGITGIGGFSITGTASTFTSCTIPIDSGLGGAIYLDIQTGGETKYDITVASYLTGNDAKYGKNLLDQVNSKLKY